MGLLIGYSNSHQEPYKQNLRGISIEFTPVVEVLIKQKAKFTVSDKLRIFSAVQKEQFGVKSDNNSQLLA